MLTEKYDNVAVHVIYIVRLTENYDSVAVSVD
jgi:hypothetical protein